jgi:hypothetical protein
MPKSRALIVQIVESLVYLCLLYGALAVPVFLARESVRDLVEFAVIAVPFACGFAIRWFVKRFWLALPLHLLFPVAAMILSRDLFELGIYFVAMMIIMVISLAHYFKRGIAVGNGFVFLCGLIFIVLAVWAERGGHTPLVVLYGVLLLVSTIGCLALLHMVQMDVSLDAMQLSSAQPVKRIIKFNYRLVAGFCVGILVAALVVAFAAVVPLMRVAGEILPDEWNLPTWTPRQREPRELPEGRGLDLGFPMLDGHFIEETEQPGPVAIVIQFVLVIVGLTGAAWLVFKVLQAIFILLNNRRKYYPSEFTDHAAEDEREFILPTGKKKKTRRFGEEHPVRKKFRETITRHIKLGVEIAPHDTPSDMKKRVISEDLDALVGEYVKVRYG